MQQLAGRTAVVTGAADGIGLALAERFAQEGMRVMLADIDAERLQAAVQRLQGQGREVDACVVDVSSQAAVQQLAARTVAAFGRVHLVCNNAGIGGGAADARPIWEAETADWKWAFDVNVWGVIHGIRAFVPLLLEHGEEGMVVNTASKAGLMCGSSLYATTKHTVVALSEGLEAQLRLAGSKIGVAVLCPGAVNTRLQQNSLRSRSAMGASGSPAATGVAAAGGTDLMQTYRHAVQSRMAAGQSAEEVAELLVQGLQRGDFYILPGDDTAIRARCNNILARRVVDARQSHPQFHGPAPA